MLRVLLSERNMDLNLRTRVSALGVPLTAVGTMLGQRCAECAPVSLVQKGVTPLIVAQVKKHPNAMELLK